MTDDVPSAVTIFQTGLSKLSIAKAVPRSENRNLIGLEPIGLMQGIGR